MGAIPVKPDGPMGTHDHHGVDDDGDHQLPGKVPEQEQEKEGKHPCEHQEAHKRYPILPRPEDIDAGEGFRPKLLFCGDDERIMLVLPAIRRGVQKIVNKRTFNHLGVF